MMDQNILWILQIWLSSFLIGITSLPFTSLFFERLSDKGYSISKIIGWIVISYLMFVLATLKVLKLSLISLVLILFLWTIFNLIIEKWVRIGQKVDWKKIILVEIWFLILITLFSFIKGHQPEIYQIERWMDYGFIQALFNAESLPLYDIWYLGENLNYYYFGHFIGYTVLFLSNVPLVPGFFLLVAWIFSLVGINVYRLGHDLIILLKENAGEKTKIIAGMLSFFNVILAGTMYGIVWIYQYLKYWIWGVPIPFSYYPEPTRIIKGTITEMPIYSFIVADLHAHVWGLFSGVIVLSCLYLIWRSEFSEFKKKHIWTVTFFLGIAYMINSWDALTLGILSVMIILGKYYQEIGFWDLSYLVCMPMIAYAIALPWSLFFKAPVFGIGIVKQTSELFPWLSFWGVQIIFILIFFIKNVKKRDDTKNSAFYFTIIIVSLLFLFLLEIIYVQDILKAGEWYRANTFFKVYLQIWLWLGVLLGPLIVWNVLSTEKKIIKRILVGLIVVLIFVQIIYPVKAIWQANLEGKKITGLNSGLDFWKNKYPYDYEAHSYLMGVRNGEKNKVKNIIEAEGESYTDVSRFSVFLGWPTIIGWPVHEWTWRGSYDSIGKRRDEVREIYVGKELGKAKEILDKYGINYIIVGEVEKNRYGNELNEKKLNKLGKIVFKNKKTKVVKAN